MTGRHHAGRFPSALPRLPLLALACVTWVGLGLSAGCGDSQPPLVAHTDCAQLDAIPRRLWRLSAQQYGNSLKDLLDLTSAPVLSNNGGTAEYALFSDDAAGIDSNFQFSIFQTVQSVMPDVLTRVPTMTMCASGEDPGACAQRFATSFGARAFRRPLAADEVAALMGPFTEGANQDFNTGIGLMIEALVQSPSFVFRTELGPPEAVGSTNATTLTPYETATQLSFLFRNSIPDAPLMAAAANGSLATDKGIAQQVDRLLALPEVKQNLSRIVGEWFNIRQVYSKNKGDDFLAALPPTDRDQSVVQADLITSAQMFVDSVLWSGSRHMTDLLTSNQVFVNQRLSVMYDIPFSGPAGTFGAVVPPDNYRAGMLTQPAVLWGLSNPDNTAIVKRGRFVHDDVICEDPAPSPGDLLSNPDIIAKLATLPTEIEKSDYRMATSPCNGCHSLIDPYARVLESFGPSGQYRTFADDLPVDPTADFANSPLQTGSITGPPAFAKVVNTRNLFTQCAVQKMSSYAIGRMIRVNQTCQVLDLHDEFQRTDGSITSLFKNVATAGFLRPRSGGAQ
jgi:Protein of unknown function (DUF1592)/Protein of unknown function (DUF1588)/Protein of unknown function (DUF1595)/Protein of unknown function (DUF1585)